MESMANAIGPLLESGLGNLAAYLAAHVLLCLVPAFFIAGAMAALIPQEAVTRFLGRDAHKAVSYPAAAAAGSLLAVCSCTIVPLFAGIYRKGAGLGPAITFLFFAPAANILALVYTGGVIGVDLAAARFILSLAFGIGIGLIMALVFRADDAAHDEAAGGEFAGPGTGRMGRGSLAFLLLWVALLLAGTLKLAFLTGSAFELTLPVGDTRPWQEVLDRLVPHDEGRGEEGVIDRLGVGFVPRQDDIGFGRVGGGGEHIGARAQRIRQGQCERGGQARLDADDQRAVRNVGGPDRCRCGDG